MKKRILCLALSLVAVVGLLCANGTYAWFLTTSGAGNDVSSLHNFSSGNIGVSVAGDFKKLADKGKIQPEVELLADLSADLKKDIGIDNEATANKLYIKSTSLVNTDVRIKITYTYFETTKDETTGIETTVLKDAVLYRGEDTEFVAEVAEGWTFNTEDNYFYCENSLPAVTGANAEYLPVFTSLRYSGENSDFPANLYNKETNFNVTVTFEAKQADFVEWQTLDSLVNEGEFKFEEVTDATTSTEVQE